MRIVTVAVAALLFACGGNSGNDTSQSKGPPALQYVVSVNAQGDGLVRGLANDCRGACTQRYDAGSSVTLRAVADAGASFDGWSGACTGTSDCTLSVNGDMTVGAAFGHHATPQHQLTVLVDGHGSVRSAPSGIDCGATCAAPFDQGSMVTLTAAPDSGWLLAGFSGACSGATGCSVTMSADALVRVRFDAVPPPPPPAMVNLSVAVDGQGSVSGAGINCPGTCSAHVAAGTPVTLTANAASGARFMGFSGACTGATCAFAANTDSAVSAKFAQEVITLAPADGTNSDVFAINSTHVFLQRYGNNIYGIWSVPKAGGEPVMLTNACCAGGMVADDQFVYWSDYNGINRVPAAGGQNVKLHSIYVIGGFAVDGDNLFWTSTYQGSVAYPPVGVYAGSATGGTGDLIASGTYPRALAIDTQYVYFTDKNGDGMIKRVPRAGGPTVTLVDCGACFPVAVRVDFDNFYYRNADGDLWAHPKNGSTFTQLNTGNPRNDLGINMDFDVNAKVAYWTWLDNNAATGLFRANVDGTGWTAIEKGAPQDQSWRGPRVDDNYIFYMHAGALYRRLK